MDTVRAPWALVGLIAGMCGLVISRVAGQLLGHHGGPITAVADLVIELTPGPLAEKAITVLGSADKPVLLVLIVLACLICGIFAGHLAQRHWLRSAWLWTPLALLGVVAVLLQRGLQPSALAAVGVGYLAWLLLTWLLSRAMRRWEATAAGSSSGASAEPHPGRRGFLLTAGVIAGVTVIAGAAGEIFDRGRRQVEHARALLRLPISSPRLPAGVGVGVDGVSPWQTPVTDFYRIDTAITPPGLTPSDWSLRIHGLVDNELTVSFADLLDRDVHERWITLNCVSNEVGGDLIGNAWWSGVRLAELLEEAGVQDGADAILQTSQDEWSCATPLKAVTGDSDALLAYAMNGEPLTIEHGFPVRTIVPGLYGFVSATKWLVDIEVTRFADVSAYWTERGWSERGPVKLSSRIDVPEGGAEVPAGRVAVGGVAWQQGAGVAGVQVSVDGGAWRDAMIGAAPQTDTWVQWSSVLDLEPGEHQLTVRAISGLGEVQTSVRRDVLPDGATGLHSVVFTVT